jgi:hypothetical protein
VFPGCVGDGIPSHFVIQNKKMILSWMCFSMSQKFLIEK